MQNSIKRQVPSKALLSTYKRNSNLFAFFLDYSLPHQSMTKGGKEKWNSWTCLSSKRKRRIAKAIEKMICVYCICIYYYLPLYYIYSLYSTLENCKNTYGISFAIDLSRVTFFIDLLVSISDELWSKFTWNECERDFTFHHFCEP